MLSFPFWGWDCVFSGALLTVRKRESDGWERRMRAPVPDEDADPLPEPWRSELEASWERLFDPALPARGWSPWGRWPSAEREAVFETLALAHVRRATVFVGTSRARTPRPPGVADQT